MATEITWRGLGSLDPWFSFDRDHALNCSPAFGKKWKTESINWKFQIFAPRTIEFHYDSCFKCLFRVTFYQNNDTFRIVNKTNLLIRSMTWIFCLWWLIQVMMWYLRKLFKIEGVFSHALSSSLFITHRGSWQKSKVKLISEGKSLTPLFACLTQVIPYLTTIKDGKILCIRRFLRGRP